MSMRFHRRAEIPDVDLQYEPCGFQSLGNWASDDHLAAFYAFRRSAEQMLDTPYDQRSVLVDGEALRKCAHRALEAKKVSNRDARCFFQDNFVPHRQIKTGNQQGFVTGYFEPELQASPVKSGEFNVPLYRRPPELIDLQENNRPATMDDSFDYGRFENGRISEFFDREAIQSGIFDGRGLELAWLKDKTDAFFVHVQGSARLTFPGGRVLRIAFAAKSGQPYTSLAKLLCSRLNVEPDAMTADRLAAWMRSHPQEIDEFLAHNRSYIFFRQVDGLDPKDGPMGAASVPLIAGRSLAVDRTLHGFGVPFWVDVPGLEACVGSRFSRLMIAHDTGSAITGPQRGDLFVGSGHEAGLVAGRIRHEAQLIMLVPTP
jgi:membrane-bound lytic murein transglycosylase A